MFDTYAAHLADADALSGDYRSAVRAHLADPQGPVLVTGPPATGKLNFLQDAATDAGFSVTIVAPVALDEMSALTVSRRLHAADNGVVVVIFDTDRPGVDDTVLAVLRGLASHPTVHAVFVVNTVR